MDLEKERKKAIDFLAGNQAVKLEFVRPNGRQETEGTEKWQEKKEEKVDLTPEQRLERYRKERGL